MAIAELNRIERKTLMRAPRSRVWRALTTVPEFCQWFSAKTSVTDFVPGVCANLVSTYSGEKSCDGQSFIMDIVEMTPEHRFSWRWHPGSAKPDENLSAEPTTLVEFTLEDDEEGGTLVTVVETGFEKLFENRKPRVIRENTEGWEIQMAAFARYLQ